MLWLVLGLLFGIFVAVRVRMASKRDARNDFLSRFIPIPIVVFGFVVSVLLATICPWVCATFAPVEYQEVKSVDIVTVLHITSWRGEYAQYYIEGADKTYKFDAQNATVVVSDNEVPRIVTYEPQWKNKLWCFVAWKCPVSKHRVLFLPTGAINTNRCSVCKTYALSTLCPYCSHEIPRMELCTECGCQIYKNETACVKCGAPFTAK